jgi:uncharacterized protein (DUF3084 family)
VDIAVKTVGFLSSLMALAVVLLFAWTVRSWVTAQIVKTLRDELKYVRDELILRDGEIRSLREKEAAHEQKLQLLDNRYLAMEALERSRRAHVFTLEQQARIRERYIRRLETLCQDREIDLPVREEEG